MTTLRIKGQKLAGIPALKIRDALNIGVRRENFTADLFREVCRVSDSKAQEIIQALLRESYVKPVEAPHRSLENYQWYRATQKGITLANSTGMPRMPREKGTKLLADFLRRVAEVNGNPDYLYSIRTVVVYGSYVRGENTIGDLDLAYDLEVRTSDQNEFRRLCRERIKLALEKGRSFGNLTEEIFWPMKEVRLHLKARTRGLSLHDLTEFFEMQKDAGFAYKVLVGDAEDVGRRLRDAELESETSRRTPR